MKNQISRKHRFAHRRRYSLAALATNVLAGAGALVRRPKKAATAVAAAAAVMVAGTTVGATTAQWQHTQAAPTGTITAGGLGLTPYAAAGIYRLDDAGTTQLTSTLWGVPLYGQWEINPGGQVAIIFDTTVTHIGDNLNSRLRLQFGGEMCPSSNTLAWQVGLYHATPGAGPNGLIAGFPITVTDTLAAHGTLAEFPPGAQVGALRLIVTATLDEDILADGSQVFPGGHLILEQTRFGDNLAGWAGQPNQLDPDRCKIDPALFRVALDETDQDEEHEADNTGEEYGEDDHSDSDYQDDADPDEDDLDGAYEEHPDDEHLDNGENIEDDYLESPNGIETGGGFTPDGEVIESPSVETTAPEIGNDEGNLNGNNAEPEPFAPDDEIWEHS
jgi:alternate signal-mediated exported protein